MSLTLKQILDSALGGETTKVAAATPPPADNVDDYDVDAVINGTVSAVLPPLYGGTNKTASADAPPPPAAPSAASVTAEEMAKEAMLYADALDLAADVFEQVLVKQAEALEASPTHGLDSPARAQTQPTRGMPSESHGETQPGQTPALATNEASSVVAGSGPAPKTAALHRAKLAQAAALRELGQTVMADALEQQVKEAQAKEAADASVPKGGDRLQLDENVSGPDMSNSTLVNMTRAQARDVSTREAARFISVEAQKDPGATAALSNTEGLKVSSLEDAIKTAAPAGFEMDDPNVAPLQAMLPYIGAPFVGVHRGGEGRRMEGALRGLGGSTAGGLAGMVGGGGAGAGLGALAGGGLARLMGADTRAGAGVGAHIGGGLGALGGAVYGNVQGTHLATKGMLAGRKSPAKPSAEEAAAALEAEANAPVN